MSDLSLAAARWMLPTASTSATTVSTSTSAADNLEAAKSGSRLTVTCPSRQYHRGTQTPAGLFRG